MTRDSGGCDSNRAGDKDPGTAGRGLCGMTRTHPPQEGLWQGTLGGHDKGQGGPGSDKDPEQVTGTTARGGGAVTMTGVE